MIFFPYENYKITTKLPVDKIIKRLSSKVEPYKIYRLLSKGKDSYKAYEGQIFSDSFEMNRIMWYRNYCRPTIIGTIEKGINETKICIKMRMMFIIYLCTFIWVGGFTLTGIVMTCNQLSTGKAFEPTNLLVLIFIALGYFFVLVSFKIESLESKKYISELLEEVKKSKHDI